MQFHAFKIYIVCILASVGNAEPLFELLCVMAFENLLKSAIQDYECGGLKNEEFLRKAHQIYDAFNSYPCPLLSIDNAFLMGIIFSDMAQAERENKEFYNQAIGNAGYCFLEVIEKGQTLRMRQYAAVKLAILLDHENEAVNKVVSAFRKHKGAELFDKPEVSADGQVDLESYDSELLKELGMYCVKFGEAAVRGADMSDSEKEQFDEIKKSQKFHVDKKRAKVTPVRLCRMFSDFINEHVTLSEKKSVEMSTVCF